MKFNIDSGTLCRALKAVSTAQHSRNSTSILNSVAIDAREDGVTFRATNLDQQFSMRVPCDTNEEGEACLPLAELLSFSSTFGSSDSIQIAVEKKGATVSSGRSKRTIGQQPVADFPVVPEPKGEPIAQFSTSELRRALDLVSPCVSTDDSRSVLTGLLIDLGPDGTNIVATDTHRLSLAHLDTEPIDALSLIVPRVALPSIRTLLEMSKAEEKVTLYADKSLSFVLGGASFLTRLLDDAYPHYRKVIPNPQSGTFSVDRTVFEMALKRVSTCSHESGDTKGKVWWQFDPKTGEVAMQSRSPEKGDAEAFIQGDFQENARPLNAAFNGGYGIALCSMAREAKVLSIGYNGPLNPMLITSPDLPDWQYVSMPMAA